MSVGQYNGAARPNYVPARPVADYVPRMGAAEMHAREREAAAPPREPSISAARSSAPVALCLRCYRLPDLCACDAPETTQPAVPALEDDMLPSTDGRAGVTGAAALKWLETHDAITAADLHEACGDQVTRRGAKSALQRMMSQGVLRRVSQGRYALATNATVSAEGSAPKEAEGPAINGSAGEGEGKPATEGGADEAKRAYDLRERLLDSGFCVPSSVVVNTDMDALEAWIDAVNGEQYDAPPTPAWLEPYAVHEGPFGDDAGLSLEGAAGVSQPMPAAFQPMKGEWRERSGANSCECEDCGETVERCECPSYVVANALATDTQWRDPTNADHAIVAKTMAEVAARHAEPCTADEARASLVRLRHFIDAAEVRAARPPVHPVADLEAKRNAVKTVCSIAHPGMASVLRDLLADAERLQAMAEAQS